LGESQLPYLREDIDPVWDEKAGYVTTAFSDWFSADQDIRGFLANSLEFNRDGYDRLWRQIGEQPGDPDGPEHIDLFLDAARGVNPLDHDWMLLSAALKDAVTAFEVYLETAAEEMFRRHGLPFNRSSPDRTLPWGELVERWDRFDIPIGNEDIRTIRRIRHILTHRRGELRTEDERMRFASADTLASRLVDLTEETVTAFIDTIGDHVRSLDAKAYAFTWGRRRVPALEREGE
jgi:hypothetical protein